MQFISIQPIHFHSVNVFSALVQQQLLLLLLLLLLRVADDDDVEELHARALVTNLIV